MKDTGVAREVMEDVEELVAVDPAEEREHVLVVIASFSDRKMKRLKDNGGVAGKRWLETKKRDF